MIYKIFSFFVRFLATLQPFQRNFQNKVLPTNVTNVSPLPTTKLKRVSFVSFFPNKFFKFFVKTFFGLYCRFKVIFVFIFNQFGCANNVFYIFESKTRIVFWSKKNRLWTRLTFSDTGTPGWSRLVYSRSFFVSWFLCTILTKVLPCIDLFGLNIVTLFFLKSLTCISLLKLLHLIIEGNFLDGQRSLSAVVEQPTATSSYFF